MFATGTVHGLIAGSALNFGQNIALTAASTSLTYDALVQGVRRFSDGLLHLDVPKGHRVAIYLEKRIETVVACFGTSYAGCVFVPVNPLLKPQQVSHILKDCNVQVLVTSDERLGTRIAVEHLFDLGHRTIACISGPQTVSTGAARLAGFTEAMAARGLDVDPALIAEATAFTIDEGERAMNELLDSGLPFTAVLAGNDMLAIGCIATLTGRGLRCPEDISVIGFNDMPLADRLSPPLTTLRVPYYDLGTYAADLFIEQLEGRPKREITVVQDLVVRASTGPPPD